MKVFVLTSGSYSDYSIEAIFSSKENAEAYCGLPRHAHWDEPEIEEWDIDSHMNDIRQGRCAWIARVAAAEGKVIEVMPVGGFEVGPMRRDAQGNLLFDVIAKNEAGARKAAHDKWSGWRVSLAGLTNDEVS